MDKTRLVRVSVTLDPVDVALLDRVAKLSGTNRSIELRGMLGQLRPVLRATVEAFEGATRARSMLQEAAAGATRAEFEAMVPEVEKLQNAFLGAMARLEGAAAAAELDPRSSNTGVTPPPPPPEDDEE